METKKGNMFRQLRADEITIRAEGSRDGVELLLYKDARTDQNILDETVGPMNWKKSYSNNNCNCVISIYNENIHEWISKEDVGSCEGSAYDRNKALASDAFKRAGFAWGIGRELYTAPMIYLSINDVTCTTDIKGNLVCTDTFKVEEIRYRNCDGIRAIEYLRIRNVTRDVIAYETGKEVAKKKPVDMSTEEETASSDQLKQLNELIKQAKTTPEKVLVKYNIASYDTMSKQVCERVITDLLAYLEKKAAKTA